MEFNGSITGELMADPVSTADGNTYEREAIQTWLRNHNTSPLTGVVLEHNGLTPNLALRRAIAEFMEANLKRVPRSAIQYSLPAIGVGSFKTVYRGTLTLPDAPTIQVAVLELKAGSVVRTELDIFIELGQHPRLVSSSLVPCITLCCRQVRFWGQCEDGDKQLILVELAPMG